MIANRSVDGSASRTLSVIVSRTRTPRGIVAAALLVWLGAGRLRAESVEFQIDPVQSAITLVPATFSGISVASGTRLTSTIGVIEQAAGSLSTSMSGTLFGTLTNGVLTVSPQSFIVAMESADGPFVPSATLTGSSGLVDNFGGLGVRSNGVDVSVDSSVAVRDVEAQVAGGQFRINSPADNLAVQVTRGIIDLVEYYEGEPPDYDTYDITELVDPVAVVSTSSSAVTGSFTGTIHVPFFLAYELPFNGLIELSGTAVAHRVGLPPIAGDFNGNRVVDGSDLPQWRGHFGLNGDSDADGDGDTDGADFLIWQRQVGAASQKVAARAAPEPSSVLLAAMGVLLVVARAGPSRHVARAGRR